MGDLEDLFEQFGKMKFVKKVNNESDFKSELDILLQGYSITSDSVRKSLINNIYKLHKQYSGNETIDRNKPLPSDQKWD